MVKWYSSFLRLELHPFTFHSLHPNPSSIIPFEVHRLQRQLYNVTCYGLGNSSPMVPMLKILSPACARRALKKWCFMGDLLFIGDTLSKGIKSSQCLFHSLILYHKINRTLQSHSPTMMILPIKPDRGPNLQNSEQT